MSQEKKTIEISSSDSSSDYSSDDLIEFEKFLRILEEQEKNEKKEKFLTDRTTYKRMLFMSARDGDFEMVKYLVENKKIDPDLSYDEYEVSLLSAIKNKHNDIAKYLIEYCADINSVNPSSNEPLYFAYYAKNIEMLKYLLNKKDIVPLIQSDNLYFQSDEELEQKVSKYVRQLMKEEIFKNKK